MSQGKADRWIARSPGQSPCSLRAGTICVRRNTIENTSQCRVHIMASTSIVHGDAAYVSAQLASRQVSGAYASCSRSLPVRLARSRLRHVHAVHCSTANYQSSPATEGVRTAQISIEKFLAVSRSSKATRSLNMTLEHLLGHHNFTAVPSSCACSMQTTPGGKAAENLERADAAWRRLCDAEQMPFREVIRETREPLHGSAGLQHFDAMILGGQQTFHSLLAAYMPVCLSLKQHAFLPTSRTSSAPQDLSAL